MYSSARYVFRYHYSILQQNSYTVDMQKIATRVFIGSSVLFGILGIIMVITEMDPDDDTSGFGLIVTKLFMVTVFVILTSFAVSVAGKYLNQK